MADDGQPSFWRRRWEAFLDNLLFYVAVAIATVVVGLAAAFGTDEATLPLWVVVLLGVVQAACVVALVLLFRRTSRSAAQPDQPAPHPHRRLLARIDALDEAVARLEQGMPVDWTIASTFNIILRDAQAACDDPTLREIYPFEASSRVDWDYAESGDNALVRVLLGQIRSILA